MEIKDYLHYYIGQKYRTKYVDLDGPNHWLILTAKRLDKLDDLSIEWVQLALRKLEDMTDEDAQEVGYDNAYSFLVDNNSYVNCVGPFLPRSFNYLVSQGYDVFGLIPAGLAIDAKTLNNPNNGDKGQ